MFQIQRRPFFELPCHLFVAGILFFFSGFCLLGAVTGQTPNRKGSPDLLQLEEDGVKAAVKFAAPSVVQIETIGGDASDDGVCSGTVVSADGLVLTATYNLKHEPDNIFVKAISTKSDEPKRYIANLLATDFSRNLCLLKVDLPEGVELSPAIAASLDSLRVGNTTIAVGKIYDPVAATLSVGILSAADRIWGRAVQTDAKISKSNYGGPLIDLRGETIGVLVPLSPDDSDVEAGAEWYDSGIGFAVPLEKYYRSITKMTAGDDLRQGLLGVTLGSEDPYADVPEVEYCSPKSPASECGLKPGDVIVAINDISVASQVQMKHVLGSYYADETISLTVARGDEQKTFDAKLAANIDPFEEVAIGVIADRNAGDDLAKIGFVLPKSPADDAGLISGDIISAVDSSPIKSWQDFQSAINQKNVGDTIEIVVRNESEDNRAESKTKEIELMSLTAAMPPSKAGKRPQGDEKKGEDKAGESETGVKRSSVKVAGSSNVCTAFVPEADTPKTGFPLLVWVASPGAVDLDKIESQVKQVLKDRPLVVLVPQSLNPQGWSPEEAGVIVKAMGKLKKRVTIDDQRIVIGGSATAARMSALAALLKREAFRGLVMFNSLFPNRVPQIATRPDQRLMILLATSDSFTKTDKLGKMKKVFEDRKFPVLLTSTVEPTFGDMLPKIALWIDAVDRH